VSDAVVIPLRPQPSPGQPEATDAELVENARSGSRRAFERLYRRHSRMAFGMAHRLLAGRDVDDAVQDAFVTAWERLDRLDDPQAFARWLGTIVVNSARRRIRRRALRNRLLPGHQEPAEYDRLIGRQGSAEAAAELRTLYSVLERLSTDARLAIVLRRVEGMTIPEVADAMGRSPATVKRRIREAEDVIAAHASGRRR
jgi:RNA polymerase sigma-70 factor (ECF subfamily)